ncbi:MAG: hypothetical protein Q8P10_01350 [bacterium]|nr:hypothetical protein [bacterium]
MKKFIFILIFAFILISPTPVNAAPIRNDTGVATNAGTKNDANLERVRTRTIALAQNRINSLNKLLQRIQNDKKISADNKSFLAKQVQDTINAINSLKTKIQNDTTVDEIKTDGKKIINDYKVYMVLEPKIRLLITIGNLQTLSDKISALSPKIQTLIDNEKLKGKDTTSLQNLLDDINAQQKDINSKLTKDKQKISALTAASTDAKTTFTTVRRDLAQVRADFAKIRNDVARMRNNFKINIKNSTVTPKISATP